MAPEHRFELSGDSKRFGCVFSNGPNAKILMKQIAHGLVGGSLRFSIFFWIIAHMCPGGSHYWLSMEGLVDYIQPRTTFNDLFKEAWLTRATHSIIEPGDRNPSAPLRNPTKFEETVLVHQYSRFSAHIQRFRKFSVPPECVGVYYGSMQL